MCAPISRNRGCGSTQDPWLAAYGAGAVYIWLHAATDWTFFSSCSSQGLVHGEAEMSDPLKGLIVIAGPVHAFPGPPLSCAQKHKTEDN